MISKELEQLVKENEYNFIHVKSVTSTMDGIKNYLISNNSNYIFLSDMQSCGRGRRGNSWNSSKGNIFCSISFRELFEIENHFLYSILIASSIKLALEKFNAKNILFKWPNDLLYKNAKFAGIIGETFNNNIANYMISGFGINVNSSPDIKNYKSSHIKNFSNVNSINEFLIIFFKIFFNNLSSVKKNNINHLIEYFKKSLMFLNKKVEIILNDKSSLIGIFRDINLDGSLKIEINSKIKNIYNGSIKI